MIVNREVVAQSDTCNKKSYYSELRLVIADPRKLYYKNSPQYYSFTIFTTTQMYTAE